MRLQHAEYRDSGYQYLECDVPPMPPLPESIAPIKLVCRPKAPSQVLLNLLPSCTDFLDCQALLKHRKSQGITEFEAMEARKGNRDRIGPSPRIGFEELASVT